MSGVAERTAAVIGGGLAGLSAAWELARRGWRVDLFEGRRRLGGRAGSFVDPATGDEIDHCQHVALGCCTAFLRFCRETGVARWLRRDREMYFLGPRGEPVVLRPTPLLPAPFHLARSFLGMAFLSPRERRAVARALLQLRLERSDDRPDRPPIGEWLRERGQSPAALERFWATVLVSALSEALDRISIPAARKVFVDAFLRSRAGADLHLPTVPLGQLYDQGVAPALERAGVTLHPQTPVEAVLEADDRRAELRLADGRRWQGGAVVLAAPWRQAAGLLARELRAHLPRVVDAARFESAPISAVHLCYDRRLTDRPHVVLVDRLCQWLFVRDEPAAAGVWHQVVISAARGVVERGRDNVLAEVRAELEDLFPAARGARLLGWRLVTQPDAVFSPLPGIDQRRPSQATSLGALALAGDWTATGWPATMESAIRSGQAAAAVLTAGRR